MFSTLILALVYIPIIALFGYLIYLVIKALRKYIRSEPSQQKRTETARSLGEVLKNHRVACGMTQEFVAEALGVSRQAVSKWESGRSDPSTANLMALARLFGLTPEDLLKELQ